jgi:hypothetical protein
LSAATVGKQLQRFQVQDMRTCNVNGYTLARFPQIPVENFLCGPERNRLNGRVEQLPELRDCTRPERAQVSHHPRFACRISASVER